MRTPHPDLREWSDRDDDSSPVTSSCCPLHRSRCLIEKGNLDPTKNGVVVVLWNLRLQHLLQRRLRVLTLLRLKQSNPS